MYYHNLDMLALALADKNISALEVCELVLKRIARFNPTLGAYSDIIAEQAISESRASDHRRQRNQLLGPLDGVPIAIKDLIDTTPAICKAGLGNLVNYRPQQDAGVVKKLREVGAVILGVTETDSGAFNTQTLQTTNPLAADRIVGGSSGGSGAAVAAGLAFAALGTDTGGSIRIPAACCSVAGFKPTWGEGDMTGIRPLARSCDHVGPLARCVTDLRYIQSALDSNIDITTTAKAKLLSIGIAEDYYRDAEPQVQQALRDVIDKVSQQQVRLHTVNLPAPDTVMPYHMINVCSEAADYHRQHFPELWQHYPTVAREAVDIGSTFTIEQRELAIQQRKFAGVQVGSVFDDVDVVVLPTLPMDAPLRESESVNIGGVAMPILNATVRYTALFNQTGHPVVSIPAWPLADGRAISIQLVGARGNDNHLLAIAEWFEQVLSVDIDYNGLTQKILAT